MTVQNFAAILINLDRDTDRLAHMRQQLAQAQIAFTRLPAILGDAVPDDVRGFFFAADGTPLTTMKRGEVGCYASHIIALRQIASGALGEAVLVMEDDLFIAPDLIDLLAAARARAPQGWDIIRLSCAPRRAYVPCADLDATHDLVMYSKIPVGAGAYLVTPAGARKFLERGIRGLTFDVDLCRTWFHRMKAYGIVPPPVRADAKPSSIDAVEGGRFVKGMSSRMERLKRGDHFHVLRRAACNIADLGFVSWATCGAINLADMVARHSLKRSIIGHTKFLFPLRQHRV